jgi:ubiquitin-protein ligase E3 C
VSCFYSVLLARIAGPGVANPTVRLSKEAFDTNRGLWLATDQNELYPNPHSYATECGSDPGGRMGV